MLYVKSSTGCQNIQDLYPIRVIKFKTGSALNTWLDVPLPSDMEFWNTSILNFNIVYEGNMRDGVMLGAIEYIHSRNYKILDPKALNVDAWVLLCKFNLNIV